MKGEWVDVLLGSFCYASFQMLWKKYAHKLEMKKIGIFYYDDSQIHVFFGVLRDCGAKIVRMLNILKVFVCC